MRMKCERYENQPIKTKIVITNASYSIIVIICLTEKCPAHHLEMTLII